MASFPYIRAVWCLVAALSWGAVWMFGAGIAVPLPVVAAIVAGTPLLCIGLCLLDVRSTRLADARRQLAMDAAAAAASAAQAAETDMRRQLAESEKRCRSLRESQTDVFLVRDGDCRLICANDLFYSAFGLDRETALGQPFAPELRSGVGKNACGNDPLRFSWLENGENCIRSDQQIHTVSGWRWYAWQDRFVCDEQGNTIEIQSVGRDIDAFKATEAGLRAALRAAEDASNAKTAFLTSMSREICATINGTGGLARQILGTALSAEQQVYASAIVQSCESLSDLAEDILDSSKIADGKLNLVDERTVLRCQIEAIVERFGPRAHAKGIELAVVVAPNVPTSAYLDGRRLRRILATLIGLAIRNTGAGGVRLDVTRQVAGERGTLCFRLGDTATNLPPDWPDIAGAFDSAEISTQDPQVFDGVRLGLTVARRLVRAMGGSSGYEDPAANAETGGFWFTVPERPAEPALPPAATLADLSVAVIAANPVLRQALMVQIRYAGGEPASLALEGLRAADVIVVDAGTEAEPRPLIGPVPIIPTVVLLSPSAQANLPDLRERGFAGYLVKPVRLSSLVERVLMCARLGASRHSAKTLLHGG